VARIFTGRKSGFVLRGGRMRRETLWGATTSTRTLLATVSTAVITNAGNAALLALRPFTVIRVRGVATIKSDQVVATEAQSGAVGFVVVSDQAVAIGVTAVPTPITDAESDLWLMYQMLKSEFVLASGASIDAAAGHTVLVDSRAMRKVEEGQDLIAVVESDVSGTTDGVQIATGYRFLIKLH